MDMQMAHSSGVVTEPTLVQIRQSANGARMGTANANMTVGAFVLLILLNNIVLSFAQIL
jgi:hypothetical protein